MTDDDKARVERFRDLIWRIKNQMPLGADEMLELTSTIEAQAAEIERLERSRSAWEDEARRYAGNSEYWQTETERLREAGKKLHDHATHDDDCRSVTHGSFYPTACTCGYSDAWQEWRAALGETE